MCVAGFRCRPRNGWRSIRALWTTSVWPATLKVQIQNQSHFTLTLQAERWAQIIKTLTCDPTGALSSMFYLAHEFHDDLRGGILANTNCGGSYKSFVTHFSFPAFKKNNFMSVNDLESDSLMQSKCRKKWLNILWYMPPGWKNSLIIRTLLAEVKMGTSSCIASMKNKDKKVWMRCWQPYRLLEVDLQKHLLLKSTYFFSGHDWSQGNLVFLSV